MRVNIDARWHEDPRLIKKFGRLPCEAEVPDSFGEFVREFKRFGRFSLIDPGDLHDRLTTIFFENAYD